MGLSYRIGSGCTGCLLDVYWMFTGCLLDVYWMFTGCLLDVYWMFTGCLLDVYCWVNDSRLHIMEHRCEKEAAKDKPKSPPDPEKAEAPPTNRWCVC
jgi:hypothetical protein